VGELECEKRVHLIRGRGSPALVFIPRTISAFLLRMKKAMSSRAWAPFIQFRLCRLAPLANKQVA
jgi:hypothetical protein